MAAEAGIQTSSLGIVTDQHLRTSAVGVYAAGDCAEKKSFIIQKPTRGEFGTNAVFMAKVVAQNMMGRNKVFPGIINANATTVYDWSIGSSGLTEKMAMDAGLNVVSGYSEVLDKYPMMDGMTPIRTKLVFNRDTSPLIGGSVMGKGHGAAQNVDFISFGIQMGATLEDLLSYQYATFKKCCDIFNNHHKIAPHTDNLCRVKLSKLNDFGLMTKLLIDSIVNMTYILIK